MSALPAIASQTPSPEIEKPTTRKTLEEYFALERTSDVRHEYINGYIRAMAGESPQHNRIARNFCVGFENAFGERSCESFIENIRVRVSPTLYRYPDVVALCGGAQFDAEHPPSLLNPSVIVEVLSPSTEEYDRNGKFLEYRQIPGLTDHVLVEQDHIRVIHYVRQSETQWILTEYSRFEDTLSFASLEVSLTLADIYRKVDFTVPAPPDADTAAGTSM